MFQASSKKTSHEVSHHFTYRLDKKFFIHHKFHQDQHQNRYKMKSSMAVIYSPSEMSKRAKADYVYNATTILVLKMTMDSFICSKLPERAEVVGRVPA